MDAVATAAEIVKAYCKVCRSVVDHSVVSMAGKRPGRVRCLSCEDAHPYRAKAPSPKAKAASAAKSKGGVAEEVSYANLVEGRDLSQSTSYAMTDQFADSELIDHKKFGVGVVLRVLMDRKIEVLFPEGMKTLVHCR